LEELIESVLHARKFEPDIIEQRVCDICLSLLMRELLPAARPRLARPSGVKGIALIVT
jgi:hypothetical protein